MSNVNLWPAVQASASRPYHSKSAAIEARREYGVGRSARWRDGPDSKISGADIRRLDFAAFEELSWLVRERGLLLPRPSRTRLSRVKKFELFGKDSKAGWPGLAYQ